MGRLRCRRICALWNEILTDHSIFTDVRVSYAEKLSASPDYPRDPFYAVTACLLKCVNNQTKRIVIADVDKTCDTFDDLTILINRLMKDSRMKQLIFCNSSWLGWFFGRNMEMAVDGVIQDCSQFDTLIFKNCKLPFQLEGTELEVVIPFGSVQLNARDPAIQMWDLIEKHCGIFDEAVVASQIESLSLSGRTFNYADQVLTKVQSCDPRKTSHYRGADWTDEQITHVQAAKLTPLTLRALFWCPRTE